VLFTVCGLSFALATLSGEVAEILRRGGRFFPCMWQVQPGICTMDAAYLKNDLRQLRRWFLVDGFQPFSNSIWSRNPVTTAGSISEKASRLLSMPFAAER
jgi:hypothetical protein